MNETGVHIISTTIWDCSEGQLVMERILFFISFFGLKNVNLFIFFCMNWTELTSMFTFIVHQFSFELVHVQFINTFFRNRRSLYLQASDLDPNITVFVCFTDLRPVGWSGENLQSAMKPRSPNQSVWITFTHLVVSEKKSVESKSLPIFLALLLFLGTVVLGHVDSDVITAVSSLSNHPCHLSPWGPLWPLALLPATWHRWISNLAASSSIRRSPRRWPENPIGWLAVRPGGLRRCWVCDQHSNQEEGTASQTFSKACCRRTILLCVGCRAPWRRILFHQVWLWLAIISCFENLPLLTSQVGVSSQMCAG